MSDQQAPRDQQAQGGPGEQQHQQRMPPEHYRFTAEENKALRECNRESFFFRSLPIATLMTFGVHYGVKAGYLRPSPRWGSTPKALAAATVGYFIGKFSYTRHCAEKFMQLPNSPLGEMLRKRRGQMGFQEALTMEPGYQTLPSLGTNTSPDAYLDQDSRPLNLDTDMHTTPEGLDDYHRPTMDNPGLVEEPAVSPQSVTNYEELRKKNREEFEQKRQEAFKRGSPTIFEPPPPPRRILTDAPPPPPPSQGIGRQKNKYGDVWDE